MRSLILKHCAMVAAFVLLALTAGVHQASAETKPAKAKTTASKRGVKKVGQSPLTGKPVTCPPINPAQREGVATKMGEPDRALLLEAIKAKDVDTDTRITVGRMRLTPESLKAREEKAVKLRGKLPAKTPANPKPLKGMQ